MTVMMVKTICSNQTFQKVIKYGLFYSFVIVIIISGEFYTIEEVKDPSGLDTDLGR